MFDQLISKYHDLKAERENGEGGFTLIELLVVVVIIGILIAIAIPLYLNYQKGANDKSSQSDLRAAVSALQQCYSENGNTYPVTADVTTAGSVVTFKCGGTQTEKANLSDGTSFSYEKLTAAVGDNPIGTVIMKTYNKDGKKDGGGDGSGADSTKYVYSSAAGGAIK